MQSPPGAIESAIGRSAAAHGRGFSWPERKRGLRVSGATAPQHRGRITTTTHFIGQNRAQWVLALYEFHFPWLTELRDFDEEAAYVDGQPDSEHAATDRCCPSMSVCVAGRFGPNCSGAVTIDPMKC